MKILGATLANCVHVAGISNFLSLAEQLGHDTLSLGPAVPIATLIEAIKKHDPDLVAVSYRLTPEAGKQVIASLKREIERNNLTHKRFALGCIPPLVPIASKAGIFEAIFTGIEPEEEIVAFLEGRAAKSVEEGEPAGTQLQRIKEKGRYPLLRHHFGLPSVDATVDGVRKIAMSGMVDVISIATDQNAQEHFFRPEEMKPELDGAGGVPVRSPDDLRRIYDASRCGNYPLLRIYSGTRDLIKWAELAVDTIKNAWAAIPLTWYSVLDGRSQVPLAEAIAEKQAAMRW